MLRFRSPGLLAAAAVLLFGMITPAFARTHGHVRVGVSVGFGYPYHYGPGWYGPSWYGPAYYGPAYLSDWAVIDTDVSPEKAEVWLDGEFAGVADRFDGFPGYLEVEPGRHRLEFRFEGYRTLRIDLRARPGRIYRIDRSLREGTSESAEYDRGPMEDGPLPEADMTERETMIGLRIMPADAAVYLDGTLIGSATDAERGGLREIEPGEHRIDILRPGYLPWKETILFEQGETRMIRVELQREE